MDSAKKYLRSITGFSESELESFLSGFYLKTIKKKTLLLKEGQTAQEVYFIIDGCMRLFYFKEGEDISAYFFTENMFAGAYDSFISRKPSRHYIEAVEDCTILVISYPDFQLLMNTFPKMSDLVRKVIEDRFIALHELFTAQILDSPQERYLHLQRERPDLLNRIPQHQIATYLGITKVSLSRIKNRIAKKQV